MTKQVETDDTLPLGDAQIAEVLTRWWGFDRLRPLQAEAIAAALAGRDSLVVMPTGGGKSRLRVGAAAWRPGCGEVRGERCRRNRQPEGRRAGRATGAGTRPARRRMTRNSSRIASRRTSFKRPLFAATIAPPPFQGKEPMLAHPVLLRVSPP